MSAFSFGLSHKTVRLFIGCVVQIQTRNCLGEYNTDSKDWFSMILVNEFTITSRDSLVLLCWLKSNVNTPGDPTLTLSVSSQ